MRATAQKMGQWNPSQPEDRITTSAVKREFTDFDQNTSHSSEEASLSIEFGRALSKGSRATPSRIDRSGVSEIMVDPGHNSLYDVTYSQQIQSKSSRQPGNATTPTSLRKDVSKRRPASYAQQSNELNHHEKLPTPKSDQRRSTYAAAQYTRESVENDTFQQARTQIQNRQAAVPSNNIRNTHFSSRSKPTAAVDRVSAYSDNHIPSTQRTNQTTPRSAPPAFGASFALPDLPNLTELVDGKYQDGTPIFSRDTKSRSQMQAQSSRNFQPSGVPYAPVDGLDLPIDEKELIATLHLLHDKIAQMEQESADADQKMYEYEQEIVQLRSEREQQRNVRRSDSALGSSDGEGNGKVTAWTKLQIEKTRKLNRIATCAPH